MAYAKISGECTGCTLCVNSCPFGAIRLKEKRAEITDNCIGCGVCITECKYGMISILNEKPKISVDKSLYRGVWVFAEQRSGQPLSVVLELLGKGRELADKLQEPLSAVVLGKNVRDTAAMLITYGADIVYLVDHPHLKEGHEESYTDIVVQLVNKYKPEVVLFGATVNGRSLAPRIASRLATGLTADCTGLDIDIQNRILLQTRPAFGGNLMATITCPNHRPQMATVRQNVFQSLNPDMSKNGQIIRPEVIISSENKIELLEVISDFHTNNKLAGAEVVISVGKGAGSIEQVKLAEELAQLLGGTLGATRPVVEAGWLDSACQVGQTGLTISPKLYIACGISGAVQHLAGLSSPETVIAINKDPEAPIFRVAHYSIIGDIAEVLPALINELKNNCKYTKIISD